MTTLATLKSRIRHDIFREDLDQQTGEAISDAIRYYQRKRFYFNEVRDETFPTVSAQIWYGATASAQIPEFVTLDDVFLIRAGGELTSLRRADVEEFEYLTDNGASRGEPFQYAYFGQQLGLYPIPDAPYTVRLMGHIKMPEPASDTEEGNVWMTEAFELIRCKAKTYLYGHIMQDAQSASVQKAMEREELAALQAETMSRVMYDGFRKTQF